MLILISHILTAIVLGVYTLLSDHLYKKKGYFLKGDNLASFGWAVILLLTAFLAFFVLPVNRAMRAGEAIQFLSTEATIEQARLDTTPEWERVALTPKIVEANKWLANAKHWRSSPWTNVFWPSIIDDLEPIQ